MSANLRLAEFIKSRNISGTELASMLNTSQPTISSILNEKRKLSRGMVARISSLFPDLNGEWLMTGDGEMLRDEHALANEEERMSENQVPLIPASAFAGKVKGFAPDSVSLESCEYVNTPVKGAEMAIPITGDSMEPDYPDGSIAYISRINEHAFIPWGHTVILDTENGAFIKRIYPDNQDDEYVWAKSINPEYPPMHIPKSSIFRMFRVLAVSRIFTTM